MSMTTLGLTPRISVVIPARNQLESLKKVLHALERQDCSRYSFEVIVVDDRSTDDTARYLLVFCKETNMNCRILQGAGVSAGEARNQGVAEAQGEYILFLDADTIPNRDLVRRHLQLQNGISGDKECIIGRVSMSPDLAVINQARLWETELNVKKKQLQEVEWWIFRTANTSLSRAKYIECGGFNSRLVAAEDTEIASRLSKAGVRFYYDHLIKAVHYHPMSLLDFMRKGSMYGKAVACWYREAPELRKALAARYGVYAFEISRLKKLKYIFRALFVNRLTMPFIIFLGQALRSIFFEVSDRLYWCAYKYRIRRAFRDWLSSPSQVGTVSN